MVPTIVTSYSEYVSNFGDIFQSGSTYYEYFTSLAAKEWFSGGGKSLLVTRIISGSSGYSTYASTIIPASSSAYASASVNVSGTFNSTGSINVVTGGNTYTFTITTSSLVDTATTFYVTWATPTASLSTNFINKINSKSSYTRLTAVTSSNAHTFSIISTVPGAVTTTFSGSALSGGSYNTSFEIETLTWGDIMNNTSSIIAGSNNALQSGSVNNVRSCC